MLVYETYQEYRHIFGSAIGEEYRVRGYLLLWLGVPIAYGP